MPFYNSSDPAGYTCTTEEGTLTAISATHAAFSEPG